VRVGGISTIASQIWLRVIVHRDSFKVVLTTIQLIRANNRDTTVIPLSLHSTSPLQNKDKALQKEVQTFYFKWSKICYFLEALPTKSREECVDCFITKMLLIFR